MSHLSKGRAESSKIVPILTLNCFLGCWLLHSHPASRNKANIIPATSRALDAIGPAALNHEFETVVHVRKVDHGLLESLWFGAHGVPHSQNSTGNALLSQVY